MAATGASADLLTGVTSVLAVVAHPDDESFGLGGVMERLTGRGSAAAVLCFTHGEASSLHGCDGDLGQVRPAEFAAATSVLGVGHAELLSYPDGTLSAVPPAELAAHVVRLARLVRPSHLLAFDVSGVTGHPDHIHATAAALAAAGVLGIPVLLWALPAAVAATLNEEFGTCFAGRQPTDLTALPVDRARQWDAIACHTSQATGNAVLHRRLELLGSTEHLLFARQGQASF
ncbi:MAG TPA: GlcNAc-PI de-N-acetylase [Actinobacteria bacterium]|nr:GlcNAc-PI de-N-acetylase [Actinomycetota bacterium]